MQAALLSLQMPSTQGPSQLPTTAVSSHCLASPVRTSGAPPIGAPAAQGTRAGRRERRKLMGWGGCHPGQAGVRAGPWHVAGRGLMHYHGRVGGKPAGLMRLGHLRGKCQQGA